MRMNGIIVPVVTPLDRDCKLDADCFKRLLSKLAAAGPAGIFVAGTAGLGPLLNTDVLNQALRLARELPLYLVKDSSGDAGYFTELCRIGRARGQIKIKKIDFEVRNQQTRAIFR